MLTTSTLLIHHDHFRHIGRIFAAPNNFRQRTACLYRRNHAHIRYRTSGPCGCTANKLHLVRDCSLSGLAGNSVALKVHNATAYSPYLFPLPTWSYRYMRTRSYHFPTRPHSSLPLRRKSCPHLVPLLAPHIRDRSTPTAPPEFLETSRRIHPCPVLSCPATPTVCRW